MVGHALSSVVHAAAEQESIFTGLAQATANVGASFKTVSGDLGVLFTKLQDTTVYGDTDSAKTLERLIFVTGDYDASVKLLAPTLDMAAAKHIDASMAAELMGRAVAGNFGTLSRYGLVLAKNQQAMLRHASAAKRAAFFAKLLAGKFGRAAAAQVLTYSGKIKVMGNYFGDLKEAIGSVITKGAAAPGIFEAVVEALKKMTKFAYDAGEAFVFLFNYIPALVKGSIAEMSGVIDKAVLDWYRALSALPGKLGKKYSDLALKQTIKTAADLMKGTATLARAFDVANKAANEYSDSVRHMGMAANIAAKGAKKAADATNDLTDKTQKANMSVGPFGLHLAEAAKGAHTFGERLKQALIPTKAEQKHLGLMTEATWKATLGLHGINPLIVDFTGGMSNASIQTIATARDLEQMGVTVGDVVAAFDDQDHAIDKVVSQLVKLGYQQRDTKLTSTDLKAITRKLGISMDDLKAAILHARTEGHALGYTIGGELIPALYNAREYARDAKNVMAGMFDDSFSSLLHGDVNGVVKAWKDLWGKLGDLASKALSDALADGLTGKNVQKGLNDLFTGQLSAGKKALGIGGAIAGTVGGAVGGKSGALLQAGGTFALLAAIPGVNVATAAVAAVVQLASALYSPGSDQRYKFLLDPTHGAQLDVRSGYSKSGQDAMAADVYGEFIKQREAWRALVEQFQDPTLLANLGQLQTMYGGDVNNNGMLTGYDTGYHKGSWQEYQKALTDVFIPQMLQKYFGDALKSGLKGLGFTDTSGLLGPLKGVLNSLPGTMRLDTLSGLISTLRGMGKLAVNLGDMHGQATKSTFTQFDEGTKQVQKMLDVFRAGWEGLSFPEKIEQGRKSLNLLKTWYDNSIQYLKSLIQLQDNMQHTIDQFRENVKLKSMSDAEKGTYAQDQFTKWLDVLSKATSGEGAQAAFDQAMKYLNMLDQLDTGGNSSAKLLSLADKLEAAMKSAMSGLTDPVQDQANAFAAALADLTAKIVGTGGAEGGPTVSQGLDATAEAAKSAASAMNEMRAVVVDATHALLDLAHAAKAATNPDHLDRTVVRVVDQRLMEHAMA